MVTIVIDNSYSKIAGLSPALEKELRKLLSYESDPQAAYFSGGFSRRVYMIDKHGSFPTGLLRRVFTWVLDKGLNLTIDDARVFPESQKPAKVKIKPYSSQKTACARAIEAGRGTISMPTGSGKSLVIALIASRLNVKTLVVVPSLEIKAQLREALNAFMSHPEKVTVENIDSKALTKANKQYECLIIDEAHHAAAETYQRLNKTAWTKICHRFMLTATPFRNQEHEQLLYEGIAGDVIYELTYKEAVDSGYIVPIEAYYYELPKVKVNGYTWNEVYNEIVINNTYRNMVITNQLLVNHDDNKSTLCLVKEVKHGKILAELTGLPFSHGQDEDSRDYITMFNQREIPVLIATTGLLGEGVDTRPCEYVVIAALGKAKSAFMQQVGRAVRTYPGKKSAKVILFRDPSHKWTLTHATSQFKILLDEYGITPISMEIKDEKVSKKKPGSN